MYGQIYQIYISLNAAVHGRQLPIYKIIINQITGKLSSILWTHPSTLGPYDSMTLGPCSTNGECHFKLVCFVLKMRFILFEQGPTVLGQGLRNSITQDTAHFLKLLALEVKALSITGAENGVNLTEIGKCCSGMSTQSYLKIATNSLS